MRSFCILVNAGLATAAAIARRDFSFNASSYSKANIIQRDIAIIGGGAAGTFAAVKLGDAGKSVALIEKNDHLGGHTVTYTDPATGATVDYGVKAYQNTQLTTDFFGRFDIPLTRYIPTRYATKYADFSTGQVIDGFTVNTTLTAYSDQLNKYPYLSTGFDQLQYPIPADLVLSFGDFIQKYNLQDIAYTIYGYTYGVGDILKQLTINVFQSLGAPQLAGFTGGSLTTANHDNMALYEKATTYLGNNVLLNSMVIAALRPQGNSGVALVIQQNGVYKLVLAKQLLITIPTIPSNMKPFVPDSKESDVFNQFTYSGYWVGLVSNTGLTVNTSYVNAQASTQRFHIPSTPEVYTITPTGIDGVYSWGYGSDDIETAAQAEAAVSAAIAKLGGNSSPTFVATNNHNPSKLVVSSGALQSGFYNKLFGLNGYRNTWYTGAEFYDASTGVWNYTQTAIIPRIVAAANQRCTRIDTLVDQLVSWFLPNTQVSCN